MNSYFTPNVSFLDVNVDSLRKSIDTLKKSLKKSEFNEFLNSLLRDEVWIDPFKNNLWSELTPNRGFHDNLDVAVNSGYSLCSLIITYQNLEKKLKEMKTSYTSAISNRAGAYLIISQANRIKLQLNNLLQQINNLINKIQTESRTNAHLEEQFEKLRWEFKDIDKKSKTYEELKNGFFNAAKRFSSSYAKKCSNRYVSKYANKILDNFNGGKRAYNSADEVWTKRNRAIKTIDDAKSISNELTSDSLKSVISKRVA